MTSRISAPDTPADVELRRLLDKEELRGFVMLAGAGSGKTTSLVKALDYVATKHGARLKARTQQVACITYTEIAAEEIHADVGNSPLVKVSTIHSFLWSLAKAFQKDIAQWVRACVEVKLAMIVEKQANYSTRTRQTTLVNDAANLEKLRSQLQLLQSVERYTYGTGSDYSKGVLGHEDVVTMVPELILHSKLLARIVASKYPYIFVDESQDTFPNVVEALKHVRCQGNGAVCLGFFGDPMQQIYQRGVGAIELEAGWAPIEKPQNFRSSDRVLSVINRVRSEADGLVQVPGRPPEQRIGGESFFFVLPANDQRSEHLEKVRAWLDRHSNAGSWTADSAANGDGAKILMIVHRMAAKRMGFEELYAAFHDSGSQSLEHAFAEGTAWPLQPFEDVIFPICAADAADSPAVIAVLRGNGDALDSDVPGPDIRARLTTAREAVDRIRKVVEAGGPSSVGAVLRLAVESEIVAQDARFSAYLDLGGKGTDVVLSPTILKALDAFTACDVRELPAYFQYIRQQSPYSTQHGTKGAEFRKVIVVLDDEEGNYSLYSYEKLFGIEPLSTTDRDNLAAGTDSVLERTRRLLYVCVSRAVESLAVVLFAKDAEAAVTALEESGIMAGDTVITVATLEQ